MPDKYGNYSEEEKRIISRSYANITVWDKNGKLKIKNGKLVKGYKENGGNHKVGEKCPR